MAIWDAQCTTTSDSACRNPVAAVTVRREQKASLGCPKGKKKFLPTEQGEAVGCPRRKAIFMSIYKDSQEKNGVFIVDPCG